jgi:hypothetical protein
VVQTICNTAYLIWVESTSKPAIGKYEKIVNWLLLQSINRYSTHLTQLYISNRKITMKLTKLALGVVFASAGAFGMSSAAFADSINGGTVTNDNSGNAAAVIQTVEVNGIGKTTNISAAAGNNSAIATAGTQIDVNGLSNGALTLTGSAAASDEKKVNVKTEQGGNGSNQTNETTVKLGL